MLLYILLLRFLEAEVLSVRILYEKKVDKVVNKVHNWFAEQIIGEYNKYLREAGVIIKLEGMNSLLDYKNTNEELMLSSLSGTDDINERERILKGMNESVILIASTPDPLDDITLNQDRVCQTKLITFFSKIGNINDDTMTKFISTFRSWLSASFNSAVPDIFEESGIDKMRTLVSILKDSKFESKLSLCNTETGRRRSNILDSYNSAIEDAKLAKIEELLVKISEKINLTANDKKPTGDDEDDKENSPADKINFPKGLFSENKTSRKRSLYKSKSSGKENEEPQENQQEKSEERPRKKAFRRRNPKNAIRLIRQKVQSKKIEPDKIETDNK